MFSTTFLGHQGWLFHTETTRILVDALLTKDLGHGGVVARVYPPRILDLEAFPAVDAVVISHEHEDHFDIPTLNRLDRKIPIVLSNLSSIAARKIVTEMGFTLHLAKAGSVLRVGDLEVIFFGPDHVTKDNFDEWDVLPMLVRDRDDNGNFFTGVDIEVTDQIIDQVRSLAPKLGLWCLTNNASDFSFQLAGEVKQMPPLDNMRLAAEFMKQQANLRYRGGPIYTLFCGGGLSFDGDREWINHNAFPADSQAIALSLRALAPNEPSLAPLPGQTVHLRKFEVAGVEDQLPYLRTEPRERWPQRAHRPDVALMESYLPASGKQELSAEDLTELTAALTDYARHLYGGKLYKALYSSTPLTLKGRKPNMAIVVHSSDAFHVFEYRPQECAFVLVEEEAPNEVYAVGLECWGSDLLALFRGEFGPTAIVFGRSRAWTVNAEELHFTPFSVWDFFHPLRRPDSFLTLYRNLLAREPQTVPRVRAGGAAVSWTALRFTPKPEPKPTAA